jgi:hypothetical protein
MTEMTPAQELREAAKAMRADASWPSEDFAMAVADWLDAAAEQGAYYEATGAQLHPDSYALKVARAYLGTERKTDG